MNDKRPQDGEEADGMPELDRVAPHPTVDVLAARDEDEIPVLVWHRVCDQYRQGEREVRIEIDGLDGWESAGITHYRVSEGRSNARRGFSVDADAIMLGSGSNEPNFLVAQALVDPGDVVLAEEFTYAGTLGFLRRFGADVRGVECDREGMLPDSLEYKIQVAIDDGRRPKAVYTVPTFQNPLGWVESLPRRMAVIEITARYGVPVWEDDCYVDLNFEHPDLPPAIRSLDDSGRTIYVASFSKNIAPGMRLGYVTAIKGTGGVSQFAAMAVHRFAQTGLDAHIDRARARLRASATRCWRRWRRIWTTARAGPVPPAGCSCSCRCSTAPTRWPPPSVPPRAACCSLRGRTRPRTASPVATGCGCATAGTGPRRWPPASPS